MVELREGERVDDLQIKGYQIIQNPKGFCFGMDAVLLSHYVAPKDGSRIMDLCTGTGIVPILMAARFDVEHIDALEIQGTCVDMARRSVEMNGLSEKISVMEGDVRKVRETFLHGSYDYVTVNPPYMTGSHGLTNDDMGKAIARHEICLTLSEVIQAAKWLLKPMGHIVMVHRPFRLAEIINNLKENGLEPKRMRLVYPKIDKEPNMVLIDAVKGGRERITVDPPLIVYQSDGSYSEEIYEIYYGEIPK